MTEPKKRRKKTDSNSSQIKEEKTIGKVTASKEDTEIVMGTEIKTIGADARKDSTQEKVSKNEKDTAPVILISYNDPSGKKITKQYVCDKIDLTENKRRTLMRSGPKTILDIYIEASVIEEML